MASKVEIRQRIWDYLEANNLANFPRPVHNRIPNFKGAGAAAHKLAGLKVFQKSRVFKVNPDKPQEEVRFLILQDHRNTLLVPTPRLRHGLFNRIQPPPAANKEMLRRCASAQGIRQFSSPVGLDDHVKVNMIVIGSVAVSTTGLRIGKGEGFADLECAMMKTMGAIDDETIIVTTVHDCQVIDIPEELYAPHDVCVDIIVTPTRVIEVDPKRPKPPGILWSYITAEKYAEVPILRVLRERESNCGVDVRLKDGEPYHSPPPAKRTSGVESRQRRTKGEMPAEANVENSGQATQETEQGGVSAQRKVRRQRIFRNQRRNEMGPNVERQTAASSENQKKTVVKDKLQEPDVSKVQQDSVSNEKEEKRNKKKGGVRESRDKGEVLPSLVVNQIPEGTRVSELKAIIRGMEVFPKVVKWDGRNGRAYLDFKDLSVVEEALQKLSDLKVKDVDIQVEISQRTKEQFNI